MSTPENLNNLVKEVMDRLNIDAPKSGCTGNKLSITPSQALIIGGLLGGVLTVDSVLVDKDQTVQIVLAGSLKQKTQLEKILDQIGLMPLDEVVKAMLGRYYCDP